MRPRPPRDLPDFGADAEADRIAGFTSCEAGVTPMRASTASTTAMSARLPTVKAQVRRATTTTMIST